MPYVDLGPVRTWYEQHGAGEPLLLVHPGGVGVDSRAFGPNLDGLSAAFGVYTPDRRGHGRTPDVEGPITYELMADDTISFLETVVGGPARVLGMSDGAIVSLFVALRRPDLVRQLAFVGAVFHHSAWHPSAIEGELPPDAPPVAHKLAAMHATSPALTETDLAQLSTRTLVMAGDDDEVSPEHSATMYRALPNAELAIVPGTSHGLLVEKPALCNAILLDFFTNDPVPTFAPIRRASR